MTYITSTCPRLKKPGFTSISNSRTAWVTFKPAGLYLHELLQNFITNAIKYTREGSVTLIVRRQKDDILFEVSDTGIGISKSDQAKVFDKFYRSEDYRTRETSGTGLGLYVTHKLAKKMGTTITLKSRLNHGSHFSFTLPKA
jgi:signal transduction histidine kinase